MCASRRAYPARKILTPRAVREIVKCRSAPLFLLAILFHTTLATGTPSAAGPDPKLAEELRVRDGLPNLFAKLMAGKQVRIAFLGGSITAAEGWRPKTLAWFSQHYPKADVVEINAAISGTGSDYGACRIAGDVLSKEPDLVFMEHRVNGGGGYEAKSVEGIIRQIWQHNPRTDICLVYTVSQSMLKALHAGKQPWFGDIMETIANTYGIPSIDFGVEIAGREKAGELIFKSDVEAPGKLVFSKDGVHPGNEGHEIYRDVIARSMLQMQSVGTAQAHSIPEPMEELCWQKATLLPIDQVAHSSGWKSVDPAMDTVYRDDFGRTHAMLRGAIKCDRPGETITVRWSGTTVGFSDIPQGSDMEVEVIIDQNPSPILIKRVQRESRARYARFFYLPEQTPGEHTAVLRVKKLPEGLSFYVGQVLIFGSVRTTD